MYFSILFILRKSFTIYTNDENVIELGQQYCWNENKEKFNIYINNISVDKLTDREIKFAHNLLSMYKNGEFEEGE